MLLSYVLHTYICFDFYVHKLWVMLQYENPQFIEEECVVLKPPDNRFSSTLHFMYLYTLASDTSNLFILYVLEEN